ncbi:prephenate dehydrogenase/arogenate dehydrogenase family protein [bacterium]|nr:prephenate dehydrogenase/arogenate dehydrogenase family protein [bacterium]
MKIAFLGCGQVGGALADHLQRLGYDVTIAARDAKSDSVRKLLERNPASKVDEPHKAVSDAEVVFLATPFHAVEAALGPLADELSGKIIVDCTNPVGPGLKHGLDSADSGTRRIAALVPKSRIVKAFTIYGFENFEDNSFPGYDIKPAMLFCGDDADAKKVVSELIAALGWEPVDIGGLDQALHLEHMTLLWIRMVRVHGHSPRLVWAALQG